MDFYGTLASPGATGSIHRREEDFRSAFTGRFWPVYFIKWHISRRGTPAWSLAIQETKVFFAEGLAPLRLRTKAGQNRSLPDACDAEAGGGDRQSSGVCGGAGLATGTPRERRTVSCSATRAVHVPRRPAWSLHETFSQLSGSTRLPRSHTDGQEA